MVETDFYDDLVCFKNVPLLYFVILESPQRFLRTSKVEKRVEIRQISLTTTEFVVPFSILVHVWCPRKRVYNIIISQTKEQVNKLLFYQTLQDDYCLRISDKHLFQEPL